MTRTMSMPVANPAAARPVTSRRENGAGGVWTLVRQVCVFAVILAAWQAASSARLVGYDLLPPPLEVFGATFALPFETTFWSALWSTLSAAMLGLFISALIGIPAGLVIGSKVWVYESTRFIIDLMRSKPTIALLPVLVLLFGASYKMKVIIIVLAATWPILIQSAYGARRLEPTVRDMLRSYQVPGWLQFTEVVLPNALPFIMTGLRLATALCILVAVGAELLASVEGMGYEISMARNDGASAEVLAYVIACGALGLSVNTAFSVLERMLLSWHPSVRGELS